MHIQVTKHNEGVNMFHEHQFKDIIFFIQQYTLEWAAFKFPILLFLDRAKLLSVKFLAPRNEINSAYVDSVAALYQISIP